MVDLMLHAEAGGQAWGPLGAGGEVSGRVGLGRCTRACCAAGDGDATIVGSRKQLTSPLLLLLLLLRGVGVRGRKGLYR